LEKPPISQVACPKLEQLRQIIDVKEPKPSRPALELLGKNNCKFITKNNAPWFPPNLIEVIETIINTPLPEMIQPLFKFEFTNEAAEHNWKILQDFNLDLDAALQAQQSSQLKFGSEFRPKEVLEPLLRHHPLWPRLKSQLANGADFPLDELTIEKRKEDAMEALKFGNHKGVDENEDLFKDMMKGDVDFGYSLIIPRDKLSKLEEAVISPMNIHDQAGINELGEIIKKKRLTHNQSMTYISETSVNNRTQKDKLQDVMYGSCLLRVIHQIVEYRKRHPNKRILIQKVDFKSAYRRTHLHPTTAIQTITQFVQMGLAFISLRLTFGGAPNPNFWSEVSESITDLSNALLQCKSWDPNKTKSNLQDKVPSLKPNTDTRKFTPSLPTSVQIKVSDSGQTDCYIDDLTTTIVESDENCTRASAAALLAISIIGRPLNPKDPIKRLDLVSLSKLQAEAALEEQKILLGWKLDTRSLQISLPFEKFKAWSDGIKSILRAKSTSFKELETLIGRLGHVTVIIQHAKHFMSRLRSLMHKAKNRRTIKLNDESIEDLKFHLTLLENAHTGISMNLITYRQIDRGYRSDACPAGLGGYSNLGRAWRWYIPKHLQFRATLNMLEHVGSIIGPWIDIIENNLPPFTCILSQTDSTTSAGWLKKSNFKENDNESKELTKAKLQMSREHALRLMKFKIKDYSQWFPGVENEVADSLSRDHHINDNELTSIFFSKTPSQVTQEFKISPLPQEISSFLLLMLQNLPEGTQQQERHKTSSLCPGPDGTHSSKVSNLTMTSSSKTSPTEAKHYSSHPSPKKLELDISAEDLIKDWSAKQSEPPWTTFLRPSETTINPTLERTETESLAAFYNNSTRAIKMKTLEKNNKKRCHSVL
jgi:hypothetical protein